MAGPGGKEVGRVSVRVVPNTERFRPELRAQLEKIESQEEVKIRVTPDISGFRQRVSAATKGLSANVNVGADTTGLRSQVAVATRGMPSINLDVKTNIAETAAKLALLRRLVNSPMRARIVIDNSVLLAGAYGAIRGINKVTSALGTLAKFAAIATVVTAALAPPLLALGGVGLQAAMASIGVAAGGLAALGTMGISAIFIKMATMSERVKEAWSETGKSIKQTFMEANKPTEDALVRLAPKVSAAFEQIQPNIERVSQGVGKLIDRFGVGLPVLADRVGTAMEQIFEAGRPAMEKLIDGLPSIVQGLGNMFEIIGNSPAVQRLWSGFIDGLPGFMEGFGKAVDWVATKALDMKDWFNSDSLKGFREGLSEAWEEIKDIDWSRLTQGIEDMMNEFGELAKDVNFQEIADSLGKIATGVSTVIDWFDKLGLAGSAAVLGVSAIMAAILKEITKSLIGKGAKWLVGKLFGTAGELADEVANVAIDLGGKFVESFGSGLLTGLGFGIGGLIGGWLKNMFGGDIEQDINLNITGITWPDGLSGPSGVYTVTGIVFPEGAFDSLGAVAPQLALLVPSLVSLTASFQSMTQQLVMITPLLMQMSTTLMQLNALLAPISALFQQLSTVLGPLAGIIGGVTGAFAAFRGAISGIPGIFQSLFVNFIQLGISVTNFISQFNIIAPVVRSVTQTALSIIRVFGSMLGSILSGAMQAVRNVWNGDWGGLVNTVGSTIGKVIGHVSKLPGLILGALGRVGSLLYNSGKSLVQGFINGLVSMVGKVASAARSVLQAARDFFPFSPAKEGPFSGRGWVLYSGISIGKTFAIGIRARIPDVRSAANDLAAAAQNEINNIGDRAGVEKLGDRWAEVLSDSGQVVNTPLDSLPNKVQSLVDKVNLILADGFDWGKLATSYQTDLVSAIERQRDAVVGAAKDATNKLGDEAGVEKLGDRWESVLTDSFKVLEHQFQKIPDLWNQAVADSGLAEVPNNFAKATGDQFLQDLGIQGKGAIPELFRQASQYNVTYVVKDLDEAQRKENVKKNRDALQFTRR